MWLFSLSGEIESLPRGSAEPDGQFAPPTATIAVPEDRAADLAHGEALTVELVMNTVADGRNDMPAVGRVYDADALHVVEQLVVTSE